MDGQADLSAGEGHRTSRDDVIAKVLSALVADHERQGGNLTQDQVERAIDRRNLTPEESLLVYQALSERGIEIADDLADAEEPSASAGRHSDGSDVGLIPSLLNHRLLSPSEEVELGRRIEQARAMRAALEAGRVEPGPEVDRILKLGDAAREVFVTSNIRLVHAVARRYAYVSGLGLADLMQEGTIGLMRAVELFDHTKGFKFSTYATWWIRQAVTRTIVDRGAAIRLPAHVAEKITKVRRTERRLSLLLGTKPTAQQIADELEWPIKLVVRLQSVARITTVPLDAPLPGQSSKGDGKDGPSIAEVLPSDAPSPEELAIDRALRERTAALLRTLGPREEAILRMRFGLGSNTEHTLEQVGQVYGVTRERIRQIEAKALKKLQHPARSRTLRPFLDK